MEEPLFAPAVKGIETVVSLVRVTAPIVGTAGAVPVRVMELEAADAPEKPGVFFA